MARIVITDGFTLNPGDLTWDKFRKLGEVTVYDRTLPEQVIERCASANVIVTNKTIINSETIASASDLKAIAITATGYNNVDVKKATERGIPVCNVPGYGTDSVAQHTFALLLELTNQVGKNSASVANGEWSTSVDWCYVKKPIVELAGKTLGIVGYGRIGQKVAAIAAAFGMNVIYFTPSAKKGHGEMVSLEDVFSKSDFISLHLPLQPGNASFVNQELISLMKPSAFLINTSRGQLIHEQDLAVALKSREIAGAALDVLSSEPPQPDHPLIGLPNCIITPHNAWLSVEARERIMQATFNNVKLALEGKPQNVVNF
jgi:glycerate dehydrogenase